MPTEPTKPVEVFYSYAHEDERLRDELKKQLANLRRQGVISEWYDRDISAGTEWNQEIAKHLDSARVILLLISPDFMESDYCNEVEVKRAMERHEDGSARVIPVILRPTNWKGALFSKLQALPSDARPITTWENTDEAFLNVARGIEAALMELNSQDSPIYPSSETPPLSPYSYIEPRSTVGFVDRKDHDGNNILERLRAELKPGNGHLIALWGAGGVGKTALAAEVSRSLIESYKQRITWISADGRDEFALANLLDEIALQLGHPKLRTFSLEAKKEAVKQLVGELPSLIILDNFETVKQHEQSRCLDWLSHLSPSSALITTRAKIENRVVRNVPIQPMLASEANDFLERLIQHAQHRHTFEGVNKQLIIETAEANPLILQWVFGQIDLAQDWREVLDELAQGEGDAAHRVFDRSFKLPLLNNGGRVALLALSLFVPSASRSALAEVSALDGERNRKKFKEAIRHLAALWLIRTTEGGLRLAIDGLTRDLARARLASDPRRNGIYQRFVTRLTNFASRNSRETASDLNALEAERENVLAAIDLAFATENWEFAIDAYFAVVSFLDIRGYWDEVITRGEKARTAALQIRDKHAIGSSGQIIANTLTARGEYAKAEEIYNEVLNVYRTLKSDENIADTLYNLGGLAYDRGEMERARKLYNESLEIDQGLGNERSIAGTLNALGNLASDEGKIDEARQLYNTALEINRRSDNQLAIAITLHNLGIIHEHEGELEKAHQLYNESLVIEEKLGNRKGIAQSLYSLGSLARQQGKVSDAIKLGTDSLEIRRQLGNQKGIAESLYELALISYEQENLREAREKLLEAYEIETRLGNLTHQADILEQLNNLDSELRAGESSGKTL